MRDNADELKGKFAMPVHCSLRSVKDFQRDADGRFVIEPYHQFNPLRNVRW